MIVAERRGASLDNRLQVAWNTVLRFGSFSQAEAALLAHRPVSLKLERKSANIAGLQIADLVLSPLGRHLMGKQSKEDYEIVREKLLARPHPGAGLIVLP